MTRKINAGYPLKSSLPISRWRWKKWVSPLMRWRKRSASTPRSQYSRNPLRDSGRSSSTIPSASAKISWRSTNWSLAKRKRTTKRSWTKRASSPWILRSKTTGRLWKGTIRPTYTPFLNPIAKGKRWTKNIAGSRRLWLSFTLIWPTLKRIRI